MKKYWEVDEVKLLAFVAAGFAFLFGVLIWRNASAFAFSVAGVLTLFGEGLMVWLAIDPVRNHIAATSNSATRFAAGMRKKMRQRQHRQRWSGFRLNLTLPRLPSLPKLPGLKLPARSSTPKKINLRQMMASMTPGIGVGSVLGIIYPLDWGIQPTGMVTLTNLPIIAMIVTVVCYTWMYRNNIRLIYKMGLGTTTKHGHAAMSIGISLLLWGGLWDGWALLLAFVGALIFVSGLVLTVAGALAGEHQGVVYNHTPKPVNRDY